MSPGLRRLLPWLALLGVLLGAEWLRHGLVESGALGARCGGGGAPWWCAWRLALVRGFQLHAYGWAGLAALALGLLRRRAWTAWLAAALGAFALVFYNVEAGALALLAGALLLRHAQMPAVTRG